MDKAKKKRTVQRMAFTKALNTFNEIISADGSDNKSISIAYKMLEEKMNELNATTDNVFDLLIDEPGMTDETFQKEYSDADEYRKKFLTAKFTISDRLYGGNNEASQMNPPVAPAEARKAYKLPKIELIKFGGEVREWLQFWSLFKKIHEDSNVAKEDKFQYLMQAMIPNSRAAELVKSFPPTGENYDKVIASLKNRFGRDDLQIEVYVRELLQLVLQNAITPAKDILLSSLYDKIESQLRALESLGVTTDKCAAMLFPLVESSLPEELLRAWQRSSAHNTTSQNAENTATQSKDRLTHLIKFLEAEVQNELRISMAVKGFDLKTSNSTDSEKPKKQRVRADNKDVPSAMGLLTIKNKSSACIFCNSREHESANCEQAKKMSFTERQDIVKKKYACFNCLKIGHSFKKCRVNLKCAWCSRRHVILMCPGMVKENVCQNVEPVKNECNLASLCKNPEVFMQTLRVKLRNVNNEIIVRAVIDTGSQKSYITKEAAARVGYVSIAEQMMTHSLFGGEKSNTVCHKKHVVHLSSLDDSYRCNFVALDQGTICEEIPSIKIGGWFEELAKLNIKITDTDKKAQAVSVLIGADIAGKLLTGRRHVLKCGLVAIETYLGWIIMGKVPGGEKREDATLMVTSMFVKNNTIEDLWSLDVLGITDPIEKKTQREHEEEVNKSFLSTVKINNESRYEVKLPWLENHPALSDNKGIATRRLQSTLKKLKAENIYKEYDAVFNEWLAEGIIEYVPEAEKENWGHYLPHRPVIKEGSTTRIRPVFDASAKDHQYPSLNECVEKGPNLIEMVSSILLRFNEGNIGVISDIKKAFLQISINPKDRDFLRFLWMDKNGNEVILRHCRVVFGVSSSPFILGAIIVMHLHKMIEFLESNDSCAQYSKDNVVKLLKSFYVDNCVTSVNSVEQLSKFISDAKAVMELAGFDLRGWEYNDDGIDDSRENQTAVLGITWDKQSDTLSLNVPALDEFYDVKITKRNILSMTHRVYDPLGFACPVVLCPRILLQETWAQKLSWDEEVSEDIKKRFLIWKNSLKDLQKIQIPRCLLGEIVDNDNVSIHTFCDASKLAYAAVIFMRVENGSTVKVNFVQAKTRVAPIKKEGCDARQSIPRLELLAATIGVRLTSSVLESLNLKKIKVYYWSDSSTVLAWIRRERNWTTFVWNRIKEIREFSNPEQWRHVPGTLNPADLPSRGGTVDQVLFSRWWEGPDWLQKESENWPNDESLCNEDEINKELKKSTQKKESKSTVLLTMVKENSKKDTLWYNERFSKYSKIIRVYAWVKRFCVNCKKSIELRKKNDPAFRELKDLVKNSSFVEIKALLKEFSFDEIRGAEISLIKLIQEECFVDEFDVRIKHFMPFRDGNNLIRLNTKIILRNDTFNFRCPIILPGNHEVVRLIIKEKHEELNHAGVEITLSTLREHFWVLGGRKVIRAVIEKCVSCRRHDAKPLESAPAPLPLDRIKDAAVFEVIGVDLTGPIYLREGKKAWICLFTCAVYRAVHLEIVTSLSTASFLMALRRHIARRGRPSIIYSDNGTNFVGLNNIFKKIDFVKVAKIAATKQIDWRFNPPTAAWWGGFWERLNGVLKRLLRRTLKKSCLNYEEMLTVLLDCEAVINSRPITFMSENKQEIVPLTPSMFLQEIREVGVLDLDRIESIQMDKRYAYRQKIKEHLRRRFRSEYLGALIHKESKKRNVREVNVGDVVLVESDNVKRLDWPLARVKEVIPGKDNKVRVVRLTTASGELIRPIQRIYPLELKNNNCDADVNDIIVHNFKDVSEPPKSREISDVNDKDAHVDHIVTRSGRHVKKPERLSYF